MILKSIVTANKLEVAGWSLNFYAAEQPMLLVAQNILNVIRVSVAAAIRCVDAQEVSAAMLYAQEDKECLSHEFKVDSTTT